MTQDEQDFADLFNAAEDFRSACHAMTCTDRSVVPDEPGAHRPHECTLWPYEDFNKVMDRLGVCQKQRF